MNVGFARFARRLFDSAGFAANGGFARFARRLFDSAGFAANGGFARFARRLFDSAGFAGSGGFARFARRLFDFAGFAEPIPHWPGCFVPSRYEQNYPAFAVAGGRGLKPGYFEST